MITTSWILWNIHIVVPKILSKRFVQFSLIFLNVRAVRLGNLCVLGCLSCLFGVDSADPPCYFF